MGIFVWNECFDKWEGTSGRRADQSLEDYVCRNLRQFALRDRNHPSVFVWSIGNEIPPAKPGDPKDPGMTRARCALFRSVIASTPTRPVGIAAANALRGRNEYFRRSRHHRWNYGAHTPTSKASIPQHPGSTFRIRLRPSSYGYSRTPRRDQNRTTSVDDL
jgi:beta-galactosidase